MTRSGAWTLALPALAALLLGALLFAGCAPPPDPPPDARGDAGGVGTGPPMVELGEGQSTFRPIEDGDTLLIALGCQGSQHVWITLRSRNMATRGTWIRLWMDDEAGVQVTLEFSVRLSFMPSPDGTYGELSALTLQVPEPSAVIGHPLVLHAELRDRDGLTASASRSVMVEWGDERCMAAPDGGTLDPDAAPPFDAAPELDGGL